jgi:hypothetical protein
VYSSSGTTGERDGRALSRYLSLARSCSFLSLSWGGERRESKSFQEAAPGIQPSRVQGLLTIEVHHAIRAYSGPVPTGIGPPNERCGTLLSRKPGLITWVPRS